MAENENNNLEENQDNINQINDNQNNLNQNITLEITGPTDLLNSSKNLMHQKKYNKALTYITLFLKCYPNSFEGFFLKCQIYTKLYRGNKALVLLNKVLSLLNKENDVEHLMEIKILNNRGKCFIFLNRYEEAIETYQKINELKIDAKNFLKIGVCYYNKKNIDEAINNYNKAIELNPNFTEAYFNKGICLSNQQKKEEAIEVFNKAIEIVNKTVEHKVFKDILDYLKPGDCLVRNNTKVIPARLYGVKEVTGANVEFLLLKRLEGDEWEVMVRPGKKLMPGARVSFGNGLLKAEIIDKMEGGNRKVKFEYDGIFNEILDQIGLMPLPPYIKEKLEKKEMYQTVYAKYDGSAAAPTAGLHFTEDLLDRIKNKGVEIANVTLHVGIGTFRPVKEENIEDHDMHTEHYYIKQEDADKINNTRKNGGRIIAVGTTSCRVLESVADENGMVRAVEGDTNIYIYPGYKFKCMDALITNFHLPESTLVMLVSAFAGREFVLDSYKKAVEEKYRFFSFGDAMYIGAGLEK